jgi:hypothetical protein
MRKSLQSFLFVTIIGLSMGCSEVYDLSGAVIVNDGSGQVINATDVNFCMQFTSGNTRTEEVKTNIQECTETDIEDGLALLPNAEGSYKGSPMEFSVYLNHNDEIYPATIVDSDEDVWCDNVDIDYDSAGNSTVTQFCTTNFEFYYVWHLVVPEELFNSEIIDVVE